MTGPRSRFVTTMEDYVPLGRAGRPEEVAQMVVSLLEPGSSYVNGADLIVDGGMAGAGMFSHILKDIGDPSLASMQQGSK